jgi:predicted permease
MVPILQPYREHVVGDARPALLTLFAAVALVLLIACANVANLLLVRAESRGPEFAVRAALGAGRGRLVRQILAESGVLALAASAVALLATAMALPVLVRLVPDGLPRVDAVRVDAFVALFSMTLAFVVASLAGVAPALATGRLDLTGQLGATGQSKATPATHRSGRLLIVAQVALAVIVLTATGLLVRSLQRLQDVGDHLAADRLVHVSLALPQTKYADRDLHRRFITDLAAQLESVPSIAAVTPINAVPFTGLGWDAPTFTVEGQSDDRARTNPTLNLEEIHPSYFRTFEVPLIRGRAFTEFDRSGTTPVAIVSDDVAARTWPGQEPIGKRLKMGDVTSPAPWLTVVGVAAATRYREIREPRPTLYVPAAQMLGAAHDLAIRTTLGAPAVADLVRARVRLTDADVGVMPARGFDELLDVPLARPRFNALLITLFAAGALFLAGIGLCTVMTAVVRQRRREIGVRVALGATAGDVRRLVLGEGARLVAAGSVVGLAVAGITTRVLASLLFEVRPLDAVSWIGALLLIGAVTMLALYLPARHASRVDAVSMLRA